MKTSETITKIIPAFLKAQIKIKAAVKNSINPYFKSSYADLSSVIEAVKAELNKNDIAILQPVNGMEVETILVHTSGEWLLSSTPIVSKSANDPQAMGSAISYARRYGLQSMVLLPAEDDDGNQASVKKEAKDPTDEWPDQEKDEIPEKPAMTLHFCKTHNKEMKFRGGQSWDHRAKGDLKGEQNDPTNNVVPNEAGLWYRCSGDGYKVTSLQR